MGSDGHWYAVFCRPRQEFRATEHLCNQGYSVLAPRVRTRRRRRGQFRPVLEPMFPRYLFVRLAAYRDDWSSIRSTRGVIGLVRFGDDTPIVPEPVIDWIRERIGEHGWVDLTRIEDFKRGDPVRIADGPFAGHLARFLARTGEERVMVLMELMQREHRLVLPEAAIARA